MSGEPERLDNPNQQVVRPDGSGPADEGEGASTPPPEDLSARTKAQLVELAAERGVEIPDGATKADVLAALEPQKADG